MNVLVLNCGSSSVKLAIIDVDTGKRLLSARVERLGQPAAVCRIDDGPETPCPGEGHDEALAHLLPKIGAGQRIDAVGHRVVHGGEAFVEPTRIDVQVEHTIDDLSHLAPLHNPENLAGIRAARRLLPDVPHVAVFDTAFHSTLPKRARHYAIPAALAASAGIRRYGFHGTSHAYVTAAAAAFLREDARDLRLITCHLGNGCSITAVEGGRPVETSMGMTPLEGLVMGTRSGDIDPGVLIALQRDQGLDAEGLDRLLNRESGLAGLAGGTGDMRDIEARAAQGDEAARLALNVFSHRLRKYIGAYTAVMGGVDAIVFTGGIGQNSAEIRHRACQRLEYLGARIDEEANRDLVLTDETPVADFAASNSRVRLLAAITDEQAEIARQTALLVRASHQTRDDLSIPIAVSARHVHLTQQAVEVLFGAGHTLSVFKDLSQPGQYAAEERVTLVGPKSELPGVRVVGPTRDRVQVEISRTDEFLLGIDAPVRMSGDIDNTPGITLRGPAGSLTIEDGVICSQRHIHMTTADAEHFAVKHRDVVQVAIDSEGRDLVFGDVVVRVKDSYALEMHLDTDEGNAAELCRGEMGVLHLTRGTARLSKRSTRFD